jgi:hypothetical protein
LFSLFPLFIRSTFDQFEFGPYSFTKQSHNPRVFAIQTSAMSCSVPCFSNVSYKSCMQCLCGRTNIPYLVSPWVEQLIDVYHYLPPFPSLVMMITNTSISTNKQIVTSIIAPPLPHHCHFAAN